MTRVAGGQRQNRPLLVELAVLVFDSQTLIGGTRAIGILHVAGVEEGELSMLHYGGAGVAAVALIGLAGDQSHRLVAPVQQIGGAPVAPKLGAVGAGQGVPLVEQMVASSMLNETVGIVEQTDRRRQMPVWPPRIRGGRGLPGH